MTGCKNNSENENGSAELIPVSKEIVEKLSLTRKIILEEYNENYTVVNIKRIITNKNEIEEKTNILSRAHKKTEAVISPLQKWNFLMYDEEDSLLLKVMLWTDGYVGFKSSKDYDLTLDDRVALIEIIER